MICLGLMACSCRSLPFTSPPPIAEGGSETITAQTCQADPNFVFIPGGKFLAGSDQTERDYGYRISAEAMAGKEIDRISQFEQQLRAKHWFEAEEPRQARTLPGFCIRRNLVTNQDYQAFVQATHSPPPQISETDYQHQGFLVHAYAEVRPYLWQNDLYPDGMGQHPVVLVSYDDAVAYAHWKGQQDHRVYRLPTAIEWEKAARGTEGRYFPWGNDWRAEATNWSGSGLAHTSVVGAFPLSRSIYGVEDMAGNVFEFTSTLRQVRSQTVAVMKGCSWDDLPGFCRAAYQHTRPIASRHILFGFRLVRLR
jgi:formylglycine-generating enzyme required for sulfatase activity